VTSSRDVRSHNRVGNHWEEEEEEGDFNTLWLLLSGIFTPPPAAAAAAVSGVVDAVSGDVTVALMAVPGTDEGPFFDDAVVTERTREEGDFLSVLLLQLLFLLLLLLLLLLLPLNSPHTKSVATAKECSSNRIHRVKLVFRWSFPAGNRTKHSVS
jgi:hypothetical protein